MNESTGESSNIVAEAVDRGINYFDVAPSYGNAQERLGPALAPYRKNCFLACKTEGRMKDDSRTATGRVAAAAEDGSRGFVSIPCADEDGGPGQGAWAWRGDGDDGGGEEGREDPLHRLQRPFGGDGGGGDGSVSLRHDSLSAELCAVHAGGIRAADSEEGAGKADGNPGAEEHGKDGVAGGPEEGPSASRSAGTSRRDFRTRLQWGLRWTLGHPITAAIPPGDERYFRLAMDVAQNYKPLEPHEEQALLGGAQGAEPIFHLGNDV